jgi:hypothetical protein
MVPYRIAKEMDASPIQYRLSLVGVSFVLLASSLWLWRCQPAILCKPMTLILGMRCLTMAIASVWPERFVRLAASARQNRMRKNLRKR